jgi:hypothetical protein
MQDTKTKRKSEKLTKNEHKQFKEFVRKQNTVVEAAEIIGIHRNIVDKVIYSGKASPESISLIKKTIAA